MRQYLMFEQGDFALALMEVLDNQMGSMKSIMAHDLSAVLSSALRSSNAQIEDSPDFLKALVLTFNESSAGAESQRRGWEDVSLAYNLEPPLSHVIPRLAMRQYFEVSRFLLKLKRVEYSLNGVWRQQMTEARSLQRSEELRRRRDGGARELNGSGAADDTMKQTMRECAIACSEMIQFFNQVQRYISLNVIEGAWGEFLASAGAAKSDNAFASREIDIDAWNDAHSKYIAIVHGIVCGSVGGLSFQRNLAGIFDTALQFVAAAKELYSDRVLLSRRGAAEPQSPLVSSVPAPRRGGLLEHMHKSRADSQEPQPTDHAARMRTIVTRFKTQVRGLMRVLSHSSASDLQFLVVTIDFNGTYTSSPS
ncbi:Gamma-tubulin complex component 3 [Coemansia sp. RSA 1933]|nr:Gamma-tubulin complex component 3 [Coemansia sp. RSA 1933]